MTLVGTTIGRIRVVEALGKGGMGEVYVGYDERLKRKVALKAIRAERRLDGEAKARFLREARILSQLDHPAICRIYELIEGEASDILVLELIPGKSLKQALEEDELTPGFRLHVAERVTEALMAAHAQGVAHRDLKPDNVMLTPEGGVKVLDFGLAYNPRSPSSEEAPEGSMEIGPGGGKSSVVFTDCDLETGTESLTLPSVGGSGGEEEKPLTATVPWSGADLLAGELGTTRLEARGVAGTASDFVETQRGIVMGTVAYMSPEQARGERVTVAGDLYSLGLMLQELFTGELPYEEDLELVEMLRKAAFAETRGVVGVDADLAELIRRCKSLDPAQRPTATEVAERLRWIRGKPGRRLLRRLAAALLAVVLAGALKYTWDLKHERNLAQASRQEAEDVLEFVVDLFAVQDPKSALGHEISARDLLDVGAGRIATELHDHPGSRSRLMLTMGRIYRQLGDFENARPLLEDGLAIRRQQLGEEDLEMATAFDQLASLYHDQGAFEQAEPLYQRSLAIRQEELGFKHPHVAASLNNLAFHHLARGDSEQAEELLRRALQVQEEIHGSEHAQVAVSLVNLGELYRDRGQLDRAEPALRRALQIQEKLLPAEHPDLAFSLNGLAMIHFQRGASNLAEPLFQRTLKIQEQVLGSAHPDVAVSLNNLAELYRGVGEYSRAKPLYRRALAILEQSLGMTHPRVAVTLSNLGDLYAARGEPTLAAPLYDRALTLQERAYGKDHPSVGVTLNHRADLRFEGEDPAHDEEMYRRALEIQERAFGKDHLSVAITLADLADVLARSHRHQEAERLYLRSQAAVRQLMSEEQERRDAKQHLATIRVGLGRLYQTMGAGRRASESWEQALGLIDSFATGSDEVALLHTRTLALLHLGRVDEARPLAERLLATGWRHPDLVELCQLRGLTACA